MRLVFDAEFNGLNPTQVWCVCAKDIDRGNMYLYRYDDHDFNGKVNRLLSNADLIGHNIINYDIPELERLCSIRVRGSVTDTLVLARLVNAGQQNSVEALGKQLGVSVDKVKVGNDEWDNEDNINLYVERCIADVEIQEAIWNHYKRFTEEPEWAKAVEIEHYTQRVCHEMHTNGFAFDINRAKELLTQIEHEMEELEKVIIPDAPLHVTHDNNPIKLRTTKDGRPYTSCAEYVSDASFDDGAEFWRTYFTPFNPGSATQRVEFLNQCGWKPYEKTKGHLKQERVVTAIKRKMWKFNGRKRVLKEQELANEELRLEKYRRYGWKVSEGNLSTLPDAAPRAAKLLAQWLSLDGRRGDIVEWMAAYVPNTGRIHGQFNGIGAWTGRMSHKAPNQGNIFSSFDVGDIRGDSPSPVETVKLRYNNTLRSLWQAEEGSYLVGTDASGIQLRVLAHYIDDPEYTKAVVEGRKEDGTDVHSLNARLLAEACSGRANAKTFIYAWLLGAGAGEVARILQCSTKRAATAIQQFLDGVPGLRRLKLDTIPDIWRRRYFIGLDGRKVIVPSEHHVLAGMLQNGEAVVMKHATRLWKQRLDRKRIPYKLVDFVHDEWQTETPYEETAHLIGRIQSEAIAEVGAMLDMSVPLAGEYDVGRNWYETH